MATKLTAIGAHIYAGGFTIGVKKHFNVLAHMEESPYAVATFQANFPTIPVYVGIDNWPRKQFKGVDFLYVNPPCKAFSSLGTHRPEINPTIQCHYNCLQLMKDLRPAVYAHESVCPIFTKGRFVIDRLTAESLALGYAVTYVFEDSQYLGMGLAQTRRRFFFVAHRVEIPWEMPNFDAPVITVGQALKGVKPRYLPGEYDAAKDIYREIYQYTKPGDSLIDGFNARQKALKLKEKKNHLGNVVGRPGFSFYRLREDRPCGAVVGSNVLHWKEHRKLAFNELVILNDFPRDYIWKTSMSGMGGELARGVTPGVAEWLSKFIAKGIRNNIPVKKKVFMFDVRKAPGIYTDITATHQVIKAEPEKRNNHPRSLIDDPRRIVVKVPKGENPRRSKTARAIFELYRQVKTVGEFREKAREIHPGYGAYFGEDREHGYIEIV